MWILRASLIVGAVMVTGCKDDSTVSADAPNSSDAQSAEATLDFTVVVECLKAGGQVSKNAETGALVCSAAGTVVAGTVMCKVDPTAAGVVVTCDGKDP